MILYLSHHKIFNSYVYLIFGIFSIKSKKTCVLEPKTDGYRGIHLVYKYYSNKERKEYNDLLIETQLRTKLQQIWVTTVETTSFFIGQALKLTSIRYVDVSFAQFQETVIVGNKVAINVFTQNPYSFLIEDKNVAEDYRKYFELLWKQAKKI